MDVSLEREKNRNNNAQLVALDGFPKRVGNRRSSDSSSIIYIFIGHHFNDFYASSLSSARFSEYVFDAWKLLPCIKVCPNVNGNFSFVLAL